MYFSAIWRTSKPKPKNLPKIHLEKDSLYFRIWNILALISKNYYISGNGNMPFLDSAVKIFPLKFLMFFPKKYRSEKVIFIIFFQKKLKKSLKKNWKKLEKKKFTRRKFLILQETETLIFFYVFRNESCSYVSGSNFHSSKNGRTQSWKTSYISGDETFQPQV